MTGTEQVEAYREMVAETIQPSEALKRRERGETCMASVGK